MWLASLLTAPPAILTPDPYFFWDERIMVAAPSPRFIPSRCSSKGLHNPGLMAWKDWNPDKTNFETISAPAITTFSYCPDRISLIPVKIANTPEIQAFDTTIGLFIKLKCRATIEAEW